MPCGTRSRISAGAAKAKLRGQALDWLGAELTAWGKLYDSGPPQDRPALAVKLFGWLEDGDLAGIRDTAALDKLPPEEQKQCQALWARLPEQRTVVPTSKEEGQKWRYSTQPPADGWQKVDFDDKTWQEGIGAFGNKGGDFVRTEWKTEDIWLRREFTMPEGKGNDLLLLLSRDDEAEVYINGVLALKAPGYGRYALMPLSAEAQASLKPGKNVFAVHCKNIWAAQHIDVGIVEVRRNAATARQEAKRPDCTARVVADPSSRGLLLLAAARVPPPLAVR